MLDQTRRHSFISTLLGIKHLVVAVNKMDLVDFSEETFNTIREAYLTFAEQLPGDLDIRFVPLSALEGDNVASQSEKMPWYSGPTLLEVLETVEEVAYHADAFAELEYNIFRGLAFACGNPIYGLILNGMKGLYTRIGRHYFANPEARSLALGFYHKLSALCSEGAHDQVYETVRRYGHESGEIWHRMQKNLPGDLAIQGR